MEKDWKLDESANYAYEYRRPALTADIVAMWDSRVLLITRRYNPYAGFGALPGGYVNYGESAVQGAVREFSEECNLLIPEHRFHALPPRTNPGRDPRGWVISCPFRVNLTEEEFERAGGGDDAEHELMRPNLLWDNLPPMAFDHVDILRDALVVRFLPNG